MASPTNREKLEAKRRTVVGAMVSSVQHGEPREYLVSLVGYYVEGVPHSATGLSVNQHTPPDIELPDESSRARPSSNLTHLTQASSWRMASSRSTSGGQVIDLVPVRLEVKLIDIWGIAEFIEGRQHELFCDPETVQLRLMSFLPGLD
jgi:hypothetical protein